MTYLLVEPSAWKLLGWACIPLLSMSVACGGSEGEGASSESVSGAPSEPNGQQTEGMQPGSGVGSTGAVGDDLMNAGDSVEPPSPGTGPAAAADTDGASADDLAAASTDTAPEMNSAIPDGDADVPGDTSGGGPSTPTAEQASEDEPAPEEAAAGLPTDEAPMDLGNEPATEVPDEAAVTDAAPADPTPEPEQPVVEGPSFAAVFELVFEAEGCTTGYCHGSAAGELTFDTAEQTYELLLNGEASKDSCGVSTWVVPGDPEASILWHRVRPPEMEDGEPCVEKMPQGSDGLSAEQAQVIYDWIAAGARP